MQIPKTHLPTLAAGCLLAFNAAFTASASSLMSGSGPVQMEIDILPGNDDNVIDLSRERMLPVAILGSESFNIEDFNPRTLKLRASTQNLVGKGDKTRCEKLDINNDSHMDLLCNIKTIGFGVEPGDIEVEISAGTYQRDSLRATGTIRFVAE